MTTLEKALGDHVFRRVQEYFVSCLESGGVRALTVKEAANLSEVSKPTARKYLEKMREMGILACAEIARHTWVYVPMEDVPESEKERMNEKK